MPNHTKIASGLLYFFLILNSAIILVPDKFKGFPVIGLLASSIVYFIIEKSNKKFDYKLFLVSVSFFLLLLLSIVYSNDMSYALKKLETSLSLFAYPLVFVLLYNCRKKMHKRIVETLKWVFVVALTFFLASTFTYFFLTEPHYTIKSTIVHYRTLIDLRIVGYEIHAIYLSMYIGVGVIFLVEIISKARGYRKFYNALLLAFLFLFLAILYKRGPVIALGLIGLVFLVKNKVEIKTGFYLLTLITTFILTLMFIPKHNNVNKFNEIVDIEGLKSNPNSSTALRLSIYNCGLKQAIKAPIFGYGWGDVKSVLYACYKEENPNLLLNNYNTHNQFLSMLLATGIVGLFIFFFYFYYVLKYSDKYGNQALFFLLLYFGFNMLSENILEREDGVILFAFFVNLFLFNTEIKTDNIEEK